MAIAVISPESFNTFCEAKRLVKEEFDHSLRLQSEDWVEKLHVFSVKSKNTRLKELFKELDRKN